MHLAPCHPVRYRARAACADCHCSVHLAAAARRCGLPTCSGSRATGRMRPPHLRGRAVRQGRCPPSAVVGSSLWARSSKPGGLLVGARVPRQQPAPHCRAGRASVQQSWPGRGSSGCMGARHRQRGAAGDPFVYPAARSKHRRGGERPGSAERVPCGRTASSGLS